MKRFLFILSFSLSTLSFGAQWRCGGDGYKVRAYDRNDGSGLPMYFYVADKDYGDLIFASFNQISKFGRARGLVFRANAKKNENLRKELGWDSAELYIRLRDGLERNLNQQEMYYGELTLYHDHDSQLIVVGCKRY